MRAAAIPEAFGAGVARERAAAGRGKRVGRRGVVSQGLRQQQRKHTMPVLDLSSETKLGDIPVGGLPQCSALSS